MHELRSLYSDYRHFICYFVYFSSTQNVETKRSSLFVCLFHGGDNIGILNFMLLLRRYVIKVTFAYMYKYNVYNNDTISTYVYNTYLLSILPALFILPSPEGAPFHLRPRPRPRLRHPPYHPPLSKQINPRIIIRRNGKVIP